MLIPVGIILYTVTGGLKATFISSYVHTVIIYVVLCLFVFLVYSPSKVEQLGSPAKVTFHELSFACPCHTVDMVPHSPTWSNKPIMCNCAYWSRIKSTTTHEW